MASVVATHALWLRPLARAHGVQQERGSLHDEPARLHALPLTWNLDLWLILPLALATLLYARGARRMKQKLLNQASNGRGLRRGQDWAFAMGISALVAALISPLDRLSDSLFSAHMGQHELLMLVAAPLLVFARPWQAFLAACSPRVQAPFVAFIRRPRVVSLWRILTWPALAVGLHAVVRWIWHAPPLFEAALRNEWVHGLQHGTFFSSAAIFWWALIEGRYGRAGYGVAVLFVFATAMHTGALGALLILARQSWYPLHEARTEELARDALVDQQLAGLLMWIPAGILFAAIGLGLFAAWLGESARRMGAKPAG